MKFRSGTRRKAREYEKDLTRYWKDNKTFEKSIESRPKDNNYVFYDGPPFLTGSPHHGHLLISAVKDSVARFQTMQGKHVDRRWGWDCHGLPAEVFVEKKLGIASKQEIGTKISIEDYVKECRAAMVKTGTEWEDTIERLGRWVEFQGAYKTMDAEYMESVWWAFKELYEKDKIYQGEKILIYCTKDATPISKSEVAMESSYQMDTDPSVYVKFRLVEPEQSQEEHPRHLLAWTTTPWTLPSNSAIAVNQSLEYADVEVDGEVLVLAKDLIETALTDEKHQVVEHKVLRTYPGTELVGKRYEQPFGLELDDENAFKVWHADFVHADEGTGIAHESPAYGEEDYELSRKNNFPWVMSTDEHGTFTLGEWEGRNVWEVNKEIAKTLHERGTAWKIDYIRHEYPHCHRCGTKLMYRAHPSWFMDIQGQKTQMLQQNQTTNWVPAHLKDGRFNHILESAPDWNLSRDRYWATPIPVWQGEKPDGSEVVRVIGSYGEFEELTGLKLEDYHLPNVMNVEFELDGVTMRHVGKVLDCWFESGSMPFAQYHYPFENEQEFKDNYPADFVTEAIDQTRGWFYSLMAVNVGLFETAPYKNLICTGFINAADGRKMSKKLKNYTDPVDLMDEYSADSFRFLMLSSPLTSGENFNLSDKDVGDTARKLSMIWNMYDFFTMYAEVDGWQWDGDLSDPSADVDNLLDVWILSRVHQLNQEVRQNVEQYDLASALKPILPFIDDASNWYIRRSRRRFWKSEDDTDKNQAYRTLHYVLVQLSMIMAPFTPFLSEELYQKLTGGESVHLLDWPAVGAIDEELVDRVSSTREIIKDGLALRSQHGIKVRQPLQKAQASGYGLTPKNANLRRMLLEELNVKEAQIESGGEKSLSLDLDITPELKREGIMREVVRNVQSARKQAGLEVDDRIHLSLHSDDEDIRQSIDEHADIIKAETLATTLEVVETDGSVTKINGKELVIALKKA